MNAEDLFRFQNLKESIKSVLSLQIKILQRNYSIYDQLKLNSSVDLKLLNDLLQSSSQIAENYKQCQTLENNLKKFIQLISPEIDTTNFATKNSIETLQPNKMNSAHFQIKDLNSNSSNTCMSVRKVNSYFSSKNVYGCYRYPFDYFNKKILGLSYAPLGVLLFRDVRKDQIHTFMNIKLNEYKNFEEFSGLPIPQYFKSKEFFLKEYPLKPHQYQLTKIEQKQLYNLYYSKFFASYTDIATFFTLSSMRGIATNIQLYEKFMQQNENDNNEIFIS